VRITGEAQDEVRDLVPDVETLARRLAAVDYLVDEGLATSMFLSLRLPQSLLLEGEAGVGKTEAGRSLAAVSRRRSSACSVTKESTPPRRCTSGTIPVGCSPSGWPRRAARRCASPSCSGATT
jgi:hypothetical protein